MTERILIAGVRGLGCIWAIEAHSRCSELSELLLIDADETPSKELTRLTACILMLEREGRALCRFLQWQHTG